MELNELIDYFGSAETLGENPEAIEIMRAYSREAQKITMRINTAYHEPDELADLFSELIGKPVGEGFGLFPPFYTDFGKNITIGKGVFINSDCKFQDQGGIFIDDGALIGHGVVLATLDHDLALRGASSSIPRRSASGSASGLGRMRPSPPESRSATTQW